MIGWFKFKKKDGSTEMLPVHEDPSPTQEPVDDWVPKHGDWRRELLCHCGRYSPLNFVGACPKCGHHDKFKPLTWRNEWEYSSSRHREKLNDCIFAWVGYPDIFAPWNRNFKRVDWTPDHCPIKDDE